METQEFKNENSSRTRNLSGTKLATGKEILVEVENDYDGYFENLTKELLSKVTNEKIDSVTIRALPFIPYEFSYELEKNHNLIITWYSACRVFGRSTTNKELIDALNRI